MFDSIFRLSLAILILSCTSVGLGSNAEVEALCQQGEEEILSGNSEAAITDYDRSIHLKGYDGQVYYYRAMARENIGDNTGAQNDYEAAVNYGYSQ